MQPPNMQAVSCIRTPRTHHGMVSGTHKIRTIIFTLNIESVEEASSFYAVLYRYEATALSGLHLYSITRF